MSNRGGPKTRSQDTNDTHDSVVESTDPDAILTLVEGCDAPVQAAFKALLTRLSILESRLASSEQYQRRSTLVMTNLPVTDNESETSLTASVCNILSGPGEVVTPEDIQAIHRNGKSDSKSAPPPSITIRLYNYNKKDRLLRSVPKSLSKSKSKITSKVKVTQSLCPYFIDLRKRMSEHCKDKGLAIRFIHYRSPSSGLVIKTFNKDRSKERLATKIFCFTDFLNKFSEICD